MADQRDIDTLLNGLEKQPGLPPGAVSDVREAIATSPYLISVMAQAIDLGTLRRLEVSNEPNESGHYEAKTGTVSINTAIFEPTYRQRRLDMIAGTVGHETGHALMAPAAERSLHAFAFKLDEALKEAAQYGDPVVEATPMSREYMASGRQNEALAELVSMNAVASRVTTTTGEVKRSELLRRLEPTTACVKDGELAPGIHLDPRGLQRVENGIGSSAIEAVAICHFDKSDRSLGAQGTSNYSGYYAAYAVSAGAQIWRERAASTAHTMPQLGYDLAELGVDKPQLEAAGLDLGGENKTFGFVDTSHGRQEQIEVRQLGRPRQRPEIVPAVSSPASPVLADQPEHADHGTYRRIHEWVRGTGNWNDEESRNVTAALYKQQAEDPLVKRVDRITGALGKDGTESVLAVYAPFGDKLPFFHARVDGREAAQQPAEQSLVQAEQIKVEQVRQQQVEMTQQQTAQQQVAPSRSL
jgi:hypothetical protein